MYWLTLFLVLVAGRFTGDAVIWLVKWLVTKKDEKEWLRNQNSGQAPDSSRWKRK